MIGLFNLIQIPSLIDPIRLISLIVQPDSSVLVGYYIWTSFS